MMKIPYGFEVVSIGKSLWLVDSEELRDDENGKFVGIQIVSDITKEEN